jgi:hypothetical protein
MKDNRWLKLLTYVTGLVNQELLLQNEYLAAENRVYVRIYLLDCACPIRRGPRSPRLVDDSGARPWPRWPE